MMKSRFRPHLVLLTLLAGQTALAGSQAPARFDVDCQVSQERRQSRIAAVDQRLAQLTRYRAEASRARSLFESTQSEMHAAYVASDVCDAVSTAASIVTVAGVGRKLLAKEAITLFGHLISRGGLLTMTGTRAVTLSTSVYALFKNKQLEARSIRVRVHGDEFEAQSIDQAIDLQFENAQAHGPLFAPAANFLTAPACPGQSCPMYQPEISALYDTLGSWFEQAEARAEELDSWQPDAWTHSYGQTVEHVYLPLARNALKILTLETKYYLLMRKGLTADQRECQPRR